MLIREGRIVLPSFSNTGEDLDDLHTRVQDMLLAAFGGYTATAGWGGWLHQGEVQREEVVVYDIASDAEDYSTFVMMDTIADVILTTSDQKSVYLRYPNGEVKFMERNQEQGNARAA